LTDQQRESTAILAVSVDGKENLDKMLARIAAEGGMQPDFPLLQDIDHEVIDRYGLLNEHEARGRMVPHPAVYVVDMTGHVRWRFVETNYRVRASNGDVLQALSHLK
jgi:peroxiredoxin